MSLLKNRDHVQECPVKKKLKKSSGDLGDLRVKDLTLKTDSMNVKMDHVFFAKIDFQGMLVGVRGSTISATRVGTLVVLLNPCRLGKTM